MDRYARQQVDEWAVPGVALALTDADLPLGVWTYGMPISMPAAGAGDGRVAPTPIAMAAYF